jgi:branched-chain amino acid transport system substrate-binding protein
VAQTCLFPTDVNALDGNLPNGLTTEVSWGPYHPFKFSLTAESAKDLCDAWTKAKGKAWSQPIGFKYAGFEIAADAIKRTKALNKEKLRDAIARTDLHTIVGHIKYNEKNC